MHSYMFLVTDEQLREIYGEFNATEESLKKDTETLIEWTKKQPHLPDITDTEFLTNFLLCCKNSLERTKKQLDLYYTNRAIMSEVFLNRCVDSEAMMLSWKSVPSVSLPKLTPEGDRIWITKITDHIKVHLPTAEVILEATSILSDVHLKCDRHKSVIVIYDLEHMTMAFSAVAFSLMKKFVILLTEITPMRLKKVYVLNLNPAFEQIVNFTKIFMKKKLADRLEIWNKSPKELVNVLPKDVLPSDYGGNERSMSELCDEMFLFLRGFRDWIESEKTVVADLSKKPCTDSCNKEILAEYGVEGSFRKINID